MASNQNTNVWDAISSCSIGIVIMLIALGIGGCQYLNSKAAIEYKKAGMSEKAIIEQLNK